MHLLTLVTTFVLTCAASATNPTTLLDPFPSLRSVGDTFYTSVSAAVINKTGNGTLDAVKGGCEVFSVGGAGGR
jgi:hypothetical protein